MEVPLPPPTRWHPQTAVGRGCGDIGAAESGEELRRPGDLRSGSLEVEGEKEEEPLPALLAEITKEMGVEGGR